MEPADDVRPGDHPDVVCPELVQNVFVTKDTVPVFTPLPELAEDQNPAPFDGSEPVRALSNESNPPPLEDEAQLEEQTIADGISAQEFLARLDPSQLVEGRYFCRVWDPDTGTFYFVDQVSGFSLWEAPEGCVFLNSEAIPANEEIVEDEQVHFYEEEEEEPPNKYDKLKKDATHATARSELTIVEDRLDEAREADAALESKMAPSGALGFRSRYKKDCGTKELKHLSFAKVKEEVDANHPRRLCVEDWINPETGKSERVERYRKYPICSTRSGWHCWRPMCSEQRFKSMRASDFGDFGTGVMLYFKNLKFLSLLYLLLFFLLLPPMIIYIASGKMDSEAFSGTDVLGRTTIGNLGEGSQMCLEGSSGSRWREVKMECPDGATIGRIDAWYGNNTGMCGCPAAQVPDPQCDGDFACLTFSDTAAAFHGEGDSQYCAAGRHCYEGYDPSLGSRCCAASLNAEKKPDFSDLEVAYTDGCNANVATLLVAQQCFGRQGCNFTVGNDVVYPFAPDIGQSGPCHGANTTNCSMAMGGGLEGCAVNSTNRLYLLARCYDSHVVIGDRYFRKSNLAVYISMIDLFVSAVFLVAVLWLKRKERTDDASFSRMNCSPEAYTVKIGKLPKYSGLESLRRQITEHFESILTDAPPHSGLKIKVADINFGFARGELIEKMKSRGRLLKKLEADGRRKQKLSLLKGSEKKLQKLTTSIATTRATLKEVDKQMVKASEGQGRKAECAFLTFETEEGFLRCLQMYRPGFLRWTFQGRARRLAGTRVQVEPASPPSDILWENLGVSSCQRFFRVLGTYFISLLMLAGGFGLIWFLHNIKRKSAEKFVSADCETLLDVENTTLVANDVLWKEFNFTRGNTGRLGCFCKNVLFQEGPNTALNYLFYNPFTGDEEKWCRTWVTVGGCRLSLYVCAQEFTTRYSVTILAVFSVLIVNQLLKILLKLLTVTEKPHSQSSLMTSRGLKLFAVQLTNTALVVLLVNAYVRGLPFDGEFKDFSANWYISVGVSLLLTMGLNIVFPHLSVLAKVCFVWLKRCLDRSCTFDYSRSKKLTQSDLEDLHIGPQFDISTRYSQVLNMAFVCLIYCTGMPLLLLFAAVGFFVTYWIDKVLFMRFYRTPPRFGLDLAEKATALLPFAVVLHLLCSAWMLSNTSIFPEVCRVKSSGSRASQGTTVDLSTLSEYSSTQTAQARLSAFQDSIGGDYDVDLSRLFKPHIFALVVMALLVVTAMAIGRLILESVDKVCSCIVTTFCCCCTRALVAKGNPSYFRAFRTHVIEHALESNILKSKLVPRFKEVLMKRATGIDEEPERTIPPSCVMTYDIRANKEYRGAFALDSNLTKSIRTGLSRGGVLDMSAYAMGKSTSVGAHDRESRFHSLFKPDAGEGPLSALEEVEEEADPPSGEVLVAVEPVPQEKKKRRKKNSLPKADRKFTMEERYGWEQSELSRTARLEMTVRHDGAVENALVPAVYDDLEAYDSEKEEDSDDSDPMMA